jgi:uncharacterized protein (DUF433 family)
MNAATIASQIECTPGTCGGKPRITGTWIRVWDIHAWHDLQGRPPEEIVALYPQLSLADVHAALAYYLDHQQEIDCQMREAEAAVAEVAMQQTPTKYARLREARLSRTR